MSKKILIPQDVSSAGKEYLIEKGYEVIIGSGFDEDTMAKELEGCEGLLLRTAKVSSKVINGADRLKVIGRHGIGVDNIDVDAATQKGIYVTYAPLSNANTVAECAMSFITSLSRKNVIIDKNFRKYGFDYRSNIPKIDELEDKTLGLVGFGRIGKLVAEKAAKGFGMKILVFDPFVDQKKEEAHIEFASCIEDVFSNSDYVSLHMPATEETKGSVGKELLGLMKPTAYLINTSRGEVLVEQDLIDALKANAIAGAALDVFETEPIADDHPFFDLDEVILAPHIASHSKESLDRMSLHAAIGIHEVISGEQPSWPVNSPILI